jgi:ergothioneine biosynthesis protein EgtB
MSVLATTVVAEEFCRVRSQSLALCAPLTPEDMMVQSCADASPAKWHLAHTTWFFETFVLREFVSGYKPFHQDFIWLFNSYYNAVSEQPEKKLRSSFSRPRAEEILAYRHYVDAAMEDFAAGEIPEAARERIVLGLNHEQQHQELLITDIKHAFWSNPLHPAYMQGTDAIRGAGDAAPVRWVEFTGGVAEIGYQQPPQSSRTGLEFCFDNETPRHKVYLEPYRMASRPVSCAEYLAFMEDGGYKRADLWLAEGWSTVRAEGWEAPLYWRRGERGWEVFTLRGFMPVEELTATPVCHISYFEADAYARWAGKSLPTEAEWETAAAAARIEGNLIEEQKLHPQAAKHASNPEQDAVGQLFGDVWEWTVSAYLPYPGYHPLPGALGEYNGKFMCNQMVLRGGSVATPASHIRAAYRNFFAPATRWQFSGVRLAEH